MITASIRSLFQDILLFSGIFLGLCLLCFFPSLEIAETHFTTLPSLPKNQSVSPGKMIVQTYQPGVSEIQLNGTEVSKIDDQRYFFVAGLYGGFKKVLHGKVATESSIFDGLLYFPKQTFFRNYIDLKTVPLKSGNTLRLPANVRNRLKSGDEEKKKLDRQKLITALNTNFEVTSRPCWKRPIKSKITSQFGRPRTLPSGRSYYHSGVDLRAFTHTPIATANEGEVVYAGHMLVPGNNVIVSHGHGLFSRYMHLQSFKVSTGQRIETGKIIGTAGATGRVEAPHLHWEVIWKGQHADPLQFVEDWNKICDGTEQARASL